MKGNVFFAIRWIVICMTIGVVGGYGVFRIAILAINARHGCYPWSPSEVEYHDDMTLCPGQAAKGYLRIQMPPKEDKGI